MPQFIMDTPQTQHTVSKPICPCFSPLIPSTGKVITSAICWHCFVWCSQGIKPPTCHSPGRHSIHWTTEVVPGIERTNNQPVHGEYSGNKHKITIKVDINHKVTCYGFWKAIGQLNPCDIMSGHCWALCNRTPMLTQVDIIMSREQ